MLGLVMKPRGMVALQPYIERDVTADCLFLVEERKEKQAWEVTNKAFAEWIEMGDSQYGDFPEVTCGEYLSEALKMAGIEFEVYYDRKGNDEKI